LILITGAGGQVGSELVKRLSAAGVRLRTGHSSAEKAASSAAAGLDAALADFARPATLRQALVGVEKVFLVSGNSPQQRELELGALEEARRAGVELLVKLSVWGAESGAFWLAREHRLVEQAIEASGVPFVFLRPNSFMQNFVRFHADSIRDRGAFYLPGGAARISHIDVRDIAAVAAKVLTEPGHQGKAYELSGPEALTYGEIAGQLSAALGRTIAHLEISEAELTGALLESGATHSYAAALTELVRYYLAGQASRVSPAVERIIGRQPISFDQFAQDYAAIFQGGQVPQPGIS